MKKKNGFTLIELLVVVAIIAVLIAMLLPALGRARSTAKSLICTNNLRNLNLGLTMYSDEYNEWIPHYKPLSSNPAWATAGWDLYITKYFQLPSQTIINGSAQSWLRYSGNSPFGCPEVQPGTSYTFELNVSYTGNYDLGNGNYAYGLHKLRHENNPQWTMRLGDTGPGDWILNSELCNYNNIIRVMQLLAVRHMGGGNFVFGDGHIEWISGDPFKYSWSWNTRKHRIFCD